MSDIEAELEIPTPENPLRSISYIAEATGFTKPTVGEWCRKGAIKARKIGPNEEWRVLHSDFVEFCQQRWGSD